MKKFLILIIFSLTSCASNNTKINFNMSEKMNLNQFLNELENYSVNNPYPNIDN